MKFCYLGVVASPMMYCVWGSIVASLQKLSATRMPRGAPHNYVGLLFWFSCPPGRAPKRFGFQAAVFLQMLLRTLASLAPIGLVWRRIVPSRVPLSMGCGVGGLLRCFACCSLHHLFYFMCVCAGELPWCLVALLFGASPLRSSLGTLSLGVFS